MTHRITFIARIPRIAGLRLFFCSLALTLGLALAAPLQGPGGSALPLGTALAAANHPDICSDEFIKQNPDFERYINRSEQRYRNWCRKMPADLKKRLQREPLEKWWSIILCNYLGYELGSKEAAECEKSVLERQRSVESEWTEDGEYIGPSEECRKRNKRSRWGELICD